MGVSKKIVWRFRGEQLSERNNDCQKIDKNSELNKLVLSKMRGSR